jgi:membrane protein implicated in regulation of membrane protease activity
MRRLWLLLALALLVFIDLSLLPTLVLWIFVGSVLSTHGAPFLTSIVLAVVLAAGLMGLTVVTGRAWRRAPRPGHPTPN